MLNKLKSLFSVLDRSSKQETELAKSVRILRKHLKDDPGYYYAWQANIAMAFKDECGRNKIGSKVHVHAVSNAAARHFLDLLIRDLHE